MPPSHFGDGCLNLDEFCRWGYAHAADIDGLGYNSHSPGTRRGWKDSSHAVWYDGSGEGLQCGTLEWRPNNWSMTQINGFRERLLGRIREQQLP